MGSTQTLPAALNARLRQPGALPPIRWTGDGAAGDLSGLDIRALAAAPGITVVVGAAHTGVSTALRSFAGELLCQQRVALVASASRWQPRRRTLADWLTDVVIQAQPEQAHPAGDDRMRAEHAVQHTETVALIDDWAALPEAAQQAAWDQLAEYAADHAVIVGCRESAFDRMVARVSPMPRVTVLRLIRPRLSEASSAADGSAYTPPHAMPVNPPRRTAEPALDPQILLVTNYLLGALADAGPRRAVLVRRLRFLARHLDRQGTEEFRFWRLIAEVPRAVTAAVFGAAAAIAYELTFWAAYVIGEALTPGVMPDMVAVMDHALDQRAPLLGFITLTDPTRMPGHLWWVGAFTLLAVLVGYSAPEAKTQLPAAGRSRTRVNWAGGARGVRQAVLLAPVFLAAATALMAADWPSAMWQPVHEWVAGFGYQADTLWEMLLVNLMGYPVIIIMMGTRGLLTSLEAPRISLRRTNFRETLGLTRRKAIAGALAAVAGPVVGFLILFPVVDLSSDKLMTTRPGLVTLIVMGTLCGLAIAALAFLDSTWGEFVLARAYLAATDRLPYRLTEFLDYAQERGVLAHAGSVLRFRNPMVRRYLADPEITP